MRRSQKANTHACSRKATYVQDVQERTAELGLHSTRHVCAVWRPKETHTCSCRCVRHRWSETLGNPWTCMHEYRNMSLTFSHTHTLKATLPPQCNSHSLVTLSHPSFSLPLFPLVPHQTHTHLLFQAHPPSPHLHLFPPLRFAPAWAGRNVFTPPGCVCRTTA